MLVCRYFTKPPGEQKQHPDHTQLLLSCKRLIPLVLHPAQKAWQGYKPQLRVSF